MPSEVRKSSAEATPAVPRRARRGQALVELALLLPLLLVLLLGAIDFGRVFFGWVALTNASRVGANYAATHPDAWALGNTPQQNEYVELIEESGARNCDMTVNPPAFPDGSREVGDRARVDLQCNFQLVNPLLQPLVGPVAVRASSTFPIRRGCIDCEPAPAGPPPPASNHCRPIPSLVGESVAGARLKWTAAGFTGAFEPAAADDWRTVASKTIDQGENAGCDGVNFAFFSSSVFVTLAVVVEPGPTDTCLTVPNLIGMTVASARTTWEARGFDPTAFTPPTGDDARIVSVMTFDPADVQAGQCREPDEIAVEVTHVAPPPPPPPPPCKVPNFANTLRDEAQAVWNTAGFTTTVSFHPPASNWSVITQQSLVGGTHAGCTSPITLSR